MDGKAAGAIGIGSLFVYAGLKGYSILKAAQNIIQGKGPNEGQTATLLSANTPGTNGSGSTGGGNISVSPNASQTMVMSGILQGIGAPQTSANIESLVKWSLREAPWNASPPDGAEYTHNPFNTTYPAGATGEVNSIGVRIYPDWNTGIAATVATLQGYPDIVGRLKQGNGLCGWSSPDFSRWSGGGYSSIC